MILSEPLIIELTDYAKQHGKAECCGLIDETDTFYGIENVSRSRDKWDYVMDPNKFFAVLRTLKPWNKDATVGLKAFFHTHPSEHSRAIPSPYDILGASWEVVHIIYAPHVPEMNGWLWDGQLFTFEPIEGLSPDLTLVGSKTVRKDRINFDEMEGWTPWKNIELQ